MTLAERYGISRKTAYKWVDRYAADREQGLADRSRAPKAHGRAMADDVRDGVIALRRAHPRWGPKKLRAVLEEREPERAWPAASTMGDLLRRAGLSQPRRRPRYVVPLTQPLAAAQAPNDVWTADFKGWFRTADRHAVRSVDDYRRVQSLRVVLSNRPADESGVRPWFERTFRRYGLPRAVRTDNGPPFATTGAGQLSALAVWWLKLGIHVDRIAPGHPEQNGRHERFHLTLQQETTTPPGADAAAQQARFDRLRREFNAVRPHEALGQQPPARLYRPRPVPIPRGSRSRGMTPRTRCAASGTMGEIKWQGELVFRQRGPPPRAGGPGGNRAGRLARAVHAPRTGAH